MGRFRGAAAATLVAAWLCTAHAGGYGAQVFLRDRLGLTDTDLVVLARGRPVVKSLRSDNGREIAVAGVIRVDVPAGFFLSRFEDISTFKQSDGVVQIGKFSDPARIEDLDGLTFEPSELDGLRKCRIDDCTIQLGAGQIQQLHAQMDWSGPDARQRANALLRRMLVDYVRAYRERGNEALIEYRGGSERVKLNDEFRRLAADSSSLMEEVPEFRAFLLAARGAVLPDSEDFIYWSKEQFGLKPVVTLTHVIVYRPARPAASDFVVASKQIYASRYLSGSLALTLGVGERTGSRAFDLVYSNRTATAPAPFLVGPIIRHMAQSRMRTGMDKHLRLVRERLERDFAAR